MRRIIYIVFILSIVLCISTTLEPARKAHGLNQDEMSSEPTSESAPTLNKTIGAYGLADMVPYGVTTDPEGSIYVSDEYQFRMLKFNSTGSILLEWGEFGKSPGQLGLPKETAYYNGQIYVADEQNHRIQVFNTNGTFLFQWGNKGSLPGEFKRPVGIAINRAGFIYVTETGNKRVQVFNASGTFKFLWNLGAAPRGITFDTLGYVYILDVWNRRVHRFFSNGTSLSVWDIPALQPHGIAIDSVGNVYISDTWNHRIKKFNSSGILLKTWGGYGKEIGKLHAPRGIHIDSEDNLFVADSWNYRVQKFDLEGNLITVIGGNGPPYGKFNDPRRIAIDNEGNLYIDENWNHRVQKFNSSGDFVLDFGGSPPKFRDSKAFDTLNFPIGIEVSSKRIYVADTQNDRIAVFDSNGSQLFSWGKRGTGQGEFKKPLDVAVGRDYNIYVVDSGNYRLQVFDSNGSFLYSFGEGQFKHPRSVAVDPSTFDVYVALINGSITKWSHNGTFMLSFGGIGKGDGKLRNTYGKTSDSINFGLSVDSIGRVYVADTGNHRVQVFDSEGNFILKWGREGKGASEFYFPSSVEVDYSGNIYVADTYNHRVQVFNPLPTQPTQPTPIRLTFDPSYSQIPRIAVDSLGNVHVVWEDKRDGNWELYYTKLNNNGTTLVDDKRITFFRGYSYRPWIVVDLEDNVHIVWQDKRDGNPEIYYKKLDNNGSTLIDDVRVTNDTAQTYKPSLSVDSSLDIHIVFRDQRSGGWEIWYTKLNRYGEKIAEDKRITYYKRFSGGAFIALDSAQNVHLAWRDSRDGTDHPEIYYTKLSNNGTKLLPDIRLTHTYGRSYGSPIAIDQHDNVHIMWFDDRDSTATKRNWEVYYTKLDNNGTTLVDDKRITQAAGYAYHVTFTLDQNGNIHTVWRDNRTGNSEIYYAKLDNDGNKVLEDTWITVDDAYSSHPTIALDSKGDNHITWWDTRDDPSNSKWTQGEIYYAKFEDMP